MYINVCIYEHIHIYRRYTWVAWEENLDPEKALEIAAKKANALPQVSDAHTLHTHAHTYIYMYP
jgi:hypothetical protein